MAERWAAIVAYLLAIGAVARWWIVGPANRASQPVLPTPVGDSVPSSLFLWLDPRPYDAVAFVALLAILGLGALAVVLARGEAPIRHTSFGRILFFGGLAAVVPLCLNLTSVATLWMAMTLSLAVIGFRIAAPGLNDAPLDSGLGSSPAVDARRWLTLGVVGSPVFWMIDRALVAATGSTSLRGLDPAPVSVIIATILIGAVVAGVAPFAGDRSERDRSPEIGFVVDGIFPVLGVLLAARAVELENGSGRLVPVILLLVLGLAGVANAALAIRRGRSVDSLEHVEVSIAFLLLALPRPLTEASILCVGAGALIRAATRLPGFPRFTGIPWRAVGGVLGKAGPAPAAARRRRAPSIEHRLPELALWLTELVAEGVRLVEQRYDLAIGLLVALATLVVFYS
jgi:hypothetical protein